MHTLPSRLVVPRRSFSAPLLACGLLTMLWASWAPWAAVARAQSGPYVPTSADLLLQGRPAEGLLVLRSGYTNSPYVDVDALVFMGATDDRVSGDVLSVSLLLREPHGYGQARVGRFILSTGAVRPVQIDGVDVLLRAPSGSTLEAFAGLPVVPELGPRPFDWLAGTRLGQHLLQDRAGLGVSYLHRRDAGEIDAEELGADLSLTAARWLSLQATGSWSLVAHGLAEARVAALAHGTGVQVELFGTRRIASRLMPATSLFTVIGATANTQAGGDVSLQAFPRLRVGATLALEALDADIGYRAALRASLSLSDHGPGRIGVEGMRRTLGGEGYTGAALRVQLPIVDALLANATAEVVAADRPGARGDLWPWIRAGASWSLGPQWLLAGALGFKATPLYERDLYALLRIGYRGYVQP